MKSNSSSTGSSSKGDDWKGDISVKKRTNTLSVASSLEHKRRTMQGTNMSRAGGPWARSIHVWALEKK